MNRRKPVMKREVVESETLASIGYNEEAEILQIEFKDSRVYNYFKVPPYIYSDLMMAESKGKFFSLHIRNNYEYEQVL